MCRMKIHATIWFHAEKNTLKFMILLCDNNLDFECLIYAHSVGAVNIQVATL